MPAFWRRSGSNRQQYQRQNRRSNMVELANFPMISQRDGDPNQNYDCVAGAIAAGLIWLTGKHFTASQVKDAVYGRAYIGGTDAHKYVAYCAEQGVTDRKSTRLNSSHRCISY